jgi:1-acyl-sn-glycerol-3-phosphate acyltransferase
MGALKACECKVYMSDFSYSLVRGIGLHVYWVTSRRTILHRDRVPRHGPFILAANHLSPLDVFAMIGATPRHIDFLTITEFLHVPFVAQFYRAMNCTFLDRSRNHVAATHQIVTKLRRGRAIAMFPEGGIRTEETSVISGGPFKPGVIRFAQMSGAPIIPCIVLGTSAYSKIKSWLPTRSVRFGLNYGMPIPVDTVMDAESARATAAAELREAYLTLAAELRLAMRPEPGPVLSGVDPVGEVKSA